MRKMDTLFIGFMLFSMFFGAGNLIFPPFLGAESGTSYWVAIAGFILTGVGLPIIVLLAVSLVKGGAQTIGNRVHPVFSTIFMVAIYLSIGPFLAIPRNANVAFEMGLKPFLGDSVSSTVFLLGFTILFFAIAYFVSLNPVTMEKYMSRWITPTLLIAMIILCVVGFMKLNAPLGAPTAAYESGAFSKGFIEGYNTMDALAALAFGIVILSAVQQKGITDRKQLTRYTMKAGMIAGILLSLVYISLGLIGGKMASTASFKDGTEILSTTATQIFGQSGTLLLGIIFTLACFTTVVGLTTACGQYFSKLIPKASYKAVVLTITLISFTLSNLGLSQILKVSVPFLVTAYPLTIVLIVLTLFSKYFNHSKTVYKSAMLFTGVFAIMDGLAAFGLHLGPIENIVNILPFSQYGLEWIIPALVGTAIGLLLNQWGPKLNMVEEPNQL